jgi:uncharacterized protein YegJ (DUF2314 family)
MKYASQITLIILAAMLTLFAACSKKDQIISVADDDPEMLAAIAKARATLPQFWEVFDKPEHGESGFSLKVKITDKHGVEHFWATDIERTNGKIMGTINNDPEIVATVKLGDRIEIPEADISDWLYMRDNKMVGNETIRPLFKKMSEEEAAKLKSIMANP